MIEIIDYYSINRESLLQRSAKNLQEFERCTPVLVFTSCSINLFAVLTHLKLKKMRKGETPRQADTMYQVDRAEWKKDTVSSCFINSSNYNDSQRQACPLRRVVAFISGSIRPSVGPAILPSICTWVCHTASG